MEGMSGRKYRMFINNLIGSLPNARYLEIGSWTGSTSCSALFGNAVTVTCIDNWSEFEGPKDSFLKNIATWRNDRVTFSLIESDFRAIDYGKIGKFSCYLFDGPHQYQDHFDGAISALPALDHQFIFIVDDWNFREVRAGTLEALDSRGLSQLQSIEIRTTQDDGHAVINGPRSDWHNGYFIGVLKQRP